MPKKTVFVIGAGASKEANLPTGSELKSQISGILDFSYDSMGNIRKGDTCVADALLAYSNSRSIEPYLQDAKHICDAMPQSPSIDNFIDSQRGNEKIALIGKLAIVRSILNAERGSRLQQGGKFLYMNFDLLEKQTWYIPFFQMLTKSCVKEQLAERFKAVALIIFNYDRCIEHFLHSGLRNYYRISELEASNLIANISIFHPYGKVGNLSWPGNKDVIGFGANPDGSILLQHANLIRTFTEGTDPNSSEIFKIRKCMREAETLIFLGFAFHELNMKLIKVLPANAYPDS